MEFDIEEFRKKYPALYREMVESRMSLRISGIRSDDEFAEREASSKNPSIIDYLKRCDTDEQGREVIDYMLKRGEISKETAEALLTQLNEKGIRSFGPRRHLGHYLKEGI